MKRRRITLERFHRTDEDQAWEVFNMAAIVFLALASAVAAVWMVVA